MTTWQIYFATLAAWRLHPGYRKLNNAPTLRECAEMADEMMAITEEDQWVQ